MRTTSALRSLTLLVAWYSSSYYVAQAADATTAEGTASSSSTGTDEWSPGKLRSGSDEAMAAGDYERAVQYLKQAAAMEPSNTANYFKLFKVHHRKRKYMDALQEISTCVEMDSSDKYRSQKAKLLVQVGQCDRSVAEYELLTVPDEAAMQNALDCQEAIATAETAFFENDHVLAAALFQRALQYVEIASDLVWPKAQSLYFAGDFYGCISDTGKLLKQHPRHVDAYRLRGDAYHRLGEHDQAVLHYREGLKLDPEHKGCKAGHKRVKALEKKKKKGQDAFDARDFASAIEHWTKALEIDPTHEMFNRPLQLKLVIAYSRKDDHKKAMELAQEHIDVEESLEGLWALGEAQQAGDQYEQALQTFRKATEIANEGEEKKLANEKLKGAQVALKQSKEKNYYKILGLSRNADKKEVKKAYRALALKWHPDKNTDNEEEAKTMFQDIAEAYEILSDEELRAKYDRGEQVFENQGGQRRPDPFQFFNQNFQQGGGGQRQQQQQQRGGQRFHVRYG